MTSNRKIHTRRDAIQILAAGMLAGVASPSLLLGNSQVDELTSCCNQDFSLWEMSTRHLPCGECYFPSNEPAFDVHRYSSSTPTWTPSTIDELILKADEAVGVPRATVIYAHGNWMTRENSRGRALFIAQQFLRRCNVPLRLIMISWPSQRERKPVRDILENAHCADTQAHYMAWLLRKIPDTDRMGILGFSLGARVVMGALHLDAGGLLDGHAVLPSSDPQVQPNRTYRVSLAAPALDRAWLQPNGRHGKAMQNVEKLVNLYNSKDPVLRRFRFIDSPGRPVAAGFAGFVGIGDLRVTTPLVSQDRVVQYDCGSFVGISHDERSYYTKCNHFRYAIDNLIG